MLCDSEGLSASTSILDIGIIEDKFGAMSRCVMTRSVPVRVLPQRILFPIHLAANDGEQRFAVYKHPDAVLFDDFVEFPRLVDVF